MSGRSNGLGSHSVATNDHPIIVVGGGLGGAAVALALGRKGRRVRLLESAPELGVIGYGIQLGPNVFPMFDRLGVRDAVMQVATVPSTVRMRDAFTGEDITELPTGKPSFIARFKDPYIIIHRVDLHMALLDACRQIPSISLEPDMTVTGFEDHGDRVTVTIQDGRTIDGAAVIGADGLGSRIRAQLLNEGRPRLNGYVAHRTIVPMEALKADVSRDDVVLWAGPGFHIVHYPLRHCALFNIVAVFRTSTYLEKGEIEKYRAELIHTYRDAHPGMKGLLTMMDLERRWAISDRDPIRNWSRGRATLLGDAAHPTLQSYAQGACMAIEDAVYLGELVDLAGDDFAAAFQRYQAARCVRTARLQLESRSLWEIYHAEDLAREALWQELSERSDEDVYQCLAWLYDGVSLPWAS
ncbi:MAG: NAD(P)-binding protein [Rhizobiales bacterium]|nr:NAD(P)-binding protein [Hyphomicrobiales bacterium]